MGMPNGPIQGASSNLPHNVGYYAHSNEADDTASGFDIDTDDGFGDDEGSYWEYFADLCAGISRTWKTTILQPFLIGAAGAFGMSVGYAIFDFVTSLFSRKKALPPPPSKGKHTS